jgi:1-acyl-sn-glycerol-3-phosphate acyltransferase
VPILEEGRPLKFSPVPALRAVLRGCVFLGVVVASWIEYRLQRPCSRAEQACWLHRWCVRLVKLLSMRIEVLGEVPRGGLIAANHLGYLDIVVLSAIAPVVFVSKREVGRWPLFGWSSRCAGTIFVNREKRGDVSPVVEKMREVLAGGGVPIVLFPEGTSSGGDAVLPFKPSLFAVVTELRAPVTPCALRYELPGSRVAEEVCYWGDHVLVPHLFRLFGKVGIKARVAFGQAQAGGEDRKAMAKQVHAAVCALHAGE